MMTFVRRVPLVFCLSALLACGGKYKASDRDASTTAAPLTSLPPPNVLGQGRNAEADFAAEIARAPMPALPAGVTVAVVCCMYTNMATRPAVASLNVLLPPPDDSPFSPRPSAPLGTGYTIDMDQRPGAILSRPDFDLARRVAPQRAKDAVAAYAIGHAHLVTLESYRRLNFASLTYTSLMQSDSANQNRWTIYFNNGRATITVNVDIVSRSVVSTSES